MAASDWTGLIHEIGLTIAAIGGAVAAVSSMINSKKLDKHWDRLNGKRPSGAGTRKPGKKKTSSGGESDDWYQPPSF